MLLALGYFPLRQAYERGEGSIAALCFYSFCSGFGGCCAFAAAVKTSALNWPHHRGTATAFPLAAFGLSAFFFSVFAQFVFKGSTGDFLLLLAAGTFGMTFVSFFFLRVLPHPAYSSIPKRDSLSRTDSNPLIRTRSEERKATGRHEVLEPGMSFLLCFVSQPRHILILNSQTLASTSLKPQSRPARYHRCYRRALRRFIMTWKGAILIRIVRIV